MQESEKKNNPQRSHLESDTSKAPSREELIQQYKESQFFTAGQVFGNGNGHLITKVRDEVIRRNEARRKKEAAIVLRKKTKLQGLNFECKSDFNKMKNKTYKLNSKELHVLADTSMQREIKKYPVRWQISTFGGMRRR